MKKTIVLLAGIALMAAGCTKTEVITSGTEGTQKGIGFSAYTAKPTKTAQEDVITTNLTSVQASAIGNGSVYFNNVTFTKGASVWVSSPVYFWPAYSLNFYAYNTPAITTGFDITMNNTTQSVKVTPAADLADQEDLVAAYAQAKIESDATSTDSSLPLTFKHYLTQVVVNALSTNSNYTVVVDGVKLANLAGEGTYTFSTETMEATAAHKNSATSSVYDEEFTAKTLTTSSQEVMKSGADGGRWYLIPQNVSSWDKDSDTEKTNASHGTYLGLKVKITTTTGDFKVYPRTGETSAWMAIPVPAELKFEQGKKYVVTIKFFGESGNGGAGNVDPEQPGDLDGDGEKNDDAGKKIIGGAIKFDASVESWEDANTVNVTINL